ncbi:MopE-related protein [Polyangium sp. 6x1]|uniref:MopE-related protein n=1 Tax=Polyangium sp. 6x1 TaxID=3042689 RepID=UPI002482122B|nr:MopE-related protein [Polyangium sp. 6x1]MDI1451479.1 MopE-related protein [Polyangium sp. 6x1]
MVERYLLVWAALTSAGLLVGAAGCARGTTPPPMDENLLGSGGGGGSGGAGESGGGGSGGESGSAGGAACDVPEVCNGVDDDCDGVVDEDIAGLGGACQTGLSGVCGDGVAGCDGGKLFCVAKVNATNEICDGLDNDCDGVIDEDNPGGGDACDTGQSGPCAEGIRTCTAGALSCTATVVPEPEVCGDSLDNDCNGAVDDGCGSGPPACGHDPCVPGKKLDPLCDPCVATVCLMDKSCCKSTWDVFCVAMGQLHCACP